jgi:hypothetical protein
MGDIDQRDQRPEYAMFDRFTRKSRQGRGSIPKFIRHKVYDRDGFRCQFCGQHLTLEECTIDHLVPLALGGLDEVINYVTACRPCNRRKASMPLAKFAAELRLSVPDLPVHGDPIIDNLALPPAIRAIRKRIHDQLRARNVPIRGPQAQKKLEKEYRRALWQSEAGKEIERQAPTMPGHARVMIPEINTVAKTEAERLLLFELSKSANTRNLIGTVLTRGSDIISRAEALAMTSRDEALRKRLNQALARFRKASLETRAPASN